MPALPLELKIPKGESGPTSFSRFDEFAKNAGWRRLRQVRVPKDAIEVRFWTELGGGPLECYRLRRSGNVWSGLRAIERFEAVRTVETHRVKSRTGWGAFWRRINALGLRTLPDPSDFPRKWLVLDGVTYVVEFNDGKTYRTYHYSNPHYTDWPEAKKIIEIAGILHRELVSEDGTIYY